MLGGSRRLCGCVQCPLFTTQLCCDLSETRKTMGEFELVAAGQRRPRQPRHVVTAQHNKYYNGLSGHVVTRLQPLEMLHRGDVKQYLSCE